jgi:large subunit ribosomal protein L29
MKKQDLRAMDTEQLIDKEKQLREDLFRFRLKLVTGELEDISQISKARRTIARIKTILNEKKI